MLDPAVTVIQLTELTDVQGQPDPVVTATLPLLPVEGAVTLIGDTL
jgi:hypothetical protein